ncbi:hypothetical protein RCL1_001959 [Eukaryota sp. TZLM3-RCL]
MFAPLSCSYIPHDLSSGLIAVENNVASFLLKSVPFAHIFSQPPTFSSLTTTAVSNGFAKKHPLFITLLGSSNDVSVASLISSTISSSIKIRAVEIRPDSTVIDLVSLSSITSLSKSMELIISDIDRFNLLLNSFCFEKNSLLLISSPDLIILSCPPSTDFSFSFGNPLLLSFISLLATMKPLPILQDSFYFPVVLSLFSSKLSSSQIDSIFELLGSFNRNLSQSVIVRYNSLLISHVDQSELLQIQIQNQAQLTRHYESTAEQYNQLAEEFELLQEQYMEAYSLYHATALENFDFDCLAYSCTHLIDDVVPEHGVSSSNLLDPSPSVQVVSLECPSSAVSFRDVISPPPFPERVDTVIPALTPTSRKGTPKKLPPPPALNAIKSVARISLDGNSSQAKDVGKRRAKVSSTSKKVCP